MFHSYYSASSASCFQMKYFILSSFYGHIFLMGLFMVWFQLKPLEFSAKVSEELFILLYLLALHALH